MIPDIDLLQFLSAAEIDKVVQTGEFVVYNGGPSGPSYANSDAIAQANQPNTYGKKCLVRYRWKLDNGDWNSPDTIMTYGFTVNAGAWGGPISDPLPGVIGQTAIGCYEGVVAFRTLNGHHSNVTYTGSGMSPGPDSYVGYAHNFTFQYALLEIE